MGRRGILCGIAFTYFGLATIIGTKMSARPEVTGVVQNLRQYDGRRNQSSVLKIDYAGGETSDLTCGYNGSACLPRAFRSSSTKAGGGRPV